MKKAAVNNHDFVSLIRTYSLYFFAKKHGGFLGEFRPLRRATKGFSLWNPTAFEKAGETFGSPFGGVSWLVVVCVCNKNAPEFFREHFLLSSDSDNQHPQPHPSLQLLQPQPQPLLLKPLPQQKKMIISKMMIQQHPFPSKQPINKQLL